MKRAASRVEVKELTLPYSNMMIMLIRSVMVHSAWMTSRGTRSTTQPDSLDYFVKLVKEHKLNVTF